MPPQGRCVCACVRARACVWVGVYSKKIKENKGDAPVKGLRRGRMKSLLESNGVRSL